MPYNDTWHVGVDPETHMYTLASFLADYTRRRDKPWFQSPLSAWGQCSYVRGQLHGLDHARVHDGYRVAGRTQFQSGTEAFLSIFSLKFTYLVILIVLAWIVRRSVLLIAVVVLIVIVPLRRALLNRRLAIMNTWLTISLLVVGRRRLLLIMLRTNLVALLAHIEPVLAHSWNSNYKFIRRFQMLLQLTEKKKVVFKNDCSRVYSVLQGRFDSVTKRVSTKKWLNYNCT